MGTDMRTATLSASDVPRLGDFFNDPELPSAIADTSPCSSDPTFDLSHTVTITFDGSQTPVSKNVVDCHRSLYDKIDDWVTTFRTYFP